jgi:hypothetical protein
MRRLEELRQEVANIRAVFPELFRGGRRAGGSVAAGVTAEEGAGKGRRRRRRRWNMSPAQRRAVSERMKKYWAARRKAKG